MKFDLKNSKLLFEVRFRDKKYDDMYTYEMLYKRNDGKYFIHFVGSRYSPYAIKTGYYDSVGRSGNYFIEEIHIDSWKKSSLSCEQKWPEEYMVIDWEKEENEAVMDEIKLNEEFMMPMGELAQGELPF